VSEWTPVFLLARRSIVWFAVVVTLSVVAVFGLGYLDNNLKSSLAQLQAFMQEQQAQLDTKQTDLLNVQTHIQRYESLRQQGLVGDPDRALWVEQLQASHRNLGLPGTAAVQLLAAKPLGASAGSPEPVSDAPAAEPLVHDLQFEIRDSIETDVLDLIQNFRAQARGRFRVNACKLQEPKDSGLTAQCVLRFVTMPFVQNVVQAP